MSCALVEECGVVRCHAEECSVVLCVFALSAALFFISHLLFHYSLVYSNIFGSVLGHSVLFCSTTLLFPKLLYTLCGSNFQCNTNRLQVYLFIYAGSFCPCRPESQVHGFRPGNF